MDSSVILFAVQKFSWIKVSRTPGGFPAHLAVYVVCVSCFFKDFREAVSKASNQSGKPVIEERFLNQILYNLPQLYELNQDLLRELEQRVHNWYIIENIMRIVHVRCHDDNFINSEISAIHVIGFQGICIQTFIYADAKGL